MISNNLVYDLISTRKFRKLNSTNSKNLKDHTEIARRLNMSGIKIDLITEILETKYGGKFKLEDLLRFACDTSQKININVDRLAKRNRGALLCWFAENWNFILPYINNFNTKNYFIARDVKKSLKESDAACNIIDPSDIRQLINYH